MSDATHAPAKQRADFNSALNGYRGLCAGLVYLYHCGSAGVIAWPGGSMVGDAAYWLWSACTYGVEMFFMISGYVILGSLLRHSSIGGFLQDRFIRIYTAWVPSLIAVTIVCWALQMRVFAELSTLQLSGLFFANLLLLPPIVPLPMIHLVSWSLSYEWIFYFLAALGLLLSKRPHSRWLKLVWALAGAVFICLFPRSLFFVTGVLVFKYRTELASQQRRLQWPLLSLLVFLIAWRFTGANEAHLSETLFDYLLDGRWIAALIAFVAALHMFASICLKASRQTNFLSGATFQFLGTISFSFYLWHSLVMSAAKRVTAAFIEPQFGVTASFTVFVIGSLLISLPLSWLSWKFFEVKLGQVVRRWLASRPAIGGVVSVP